MYEHFSLRQMALGITSERCRVETFLADSGIRLEEVDYYAGLFDDDDELVAAGGLLGHTLKCLAVAASYRHTEVGPRLISHLVSVAAGRGGTVRTFTRLAVRATFEALGFSVIASSADALLMELGLASLRHYKHHLASLRRDGTAGAIVMNANPFTLGHRYLAEQSAARVDTLFVIMVAEDKSRFSTAERTLMTRRCLADIPNVAVVDGSDYAVSALTFPTYFLKETTDASATQMALDLDLFASHLAPSLGVGVRFVGSEPTDQLTAAYNRLMHSMLPARGIAVEEVERVAMEGCVVSASSVRRLMDEGRLAAACRLVPPATMPFLVGKLAAEALTDELNLTPKPGLVDRHDNGAHDDMTPFTMAASIDALRPHLVSLASIGAEGPSASAQAVITEGLEAERHMLEATRGVNTHKGALFSLGLMAVVAGGELATHGCVTAHRLKANISALARQFPRAKGTHGHQAARQHGLRGALDMALEGYDELFELWLPFLESHQTDSNGRLKTLLYIMSMLDDTNVCHRGGPDMLAWMKAESAAVLAQFSIERVRQMNRECIARHLSPGGSADMLALTMFAQRLIGSVEKA